MSPVRPVAATSMGRVLVGVAGGGRPSPVLLAALLALFIAPCTGLCLCCLWEVVIAAHDGDTNF